MTVGWVRRADVSSHPLRSTIRAMLICLDYVIEEAKFTVVLSNGPLLMGLA